MLLNASPTSWSSGCIFRHASCTLRTDHLGDPACSQGVNLGRGGMIMSKALAFSNNDIATIAWSYDRKLEGCLGFSIYRGDIQAGTR